ncbi:MAG TPA: alanine racemase C-terminal domain-containing protein, partial [Phycisphaerae bacterium]|nr:alanine racemase C-terminal domain-containing protein [Phycisphaerae bacterium]
RLAIVPVGYADGYPRALSNNCVAQIREVDVPVVARVSMDQIILDITELPAEIAPGELVTVISNNPEKPNSLDRMADTLNTIGYELATHLGSRLHRVIVD